MSLSREEILREMGIWPLWELRGAEESVLAAPEASGEATGARADPDRPSAHKDGTQSPAAIGDADWGPLEAAVASCKACGLSANRQQAVFGVGDRAARCLFIGEGPGAEEDKRGEPFVGPAGQLLDEMMAAIGLKRGEGVYIANAVKCRPPNNRTPSAEEIDTCRPYLLRQIQLIRPRLIVLLGKPAAQSVLGRDDAMARLRGQQFDFGGVPVVATYHPAYYLRSPLEKARGWEDLCRIRRLLQQTPE